LNGDDDEADFYEKMAKLDQLFIVNLMASEVESKTLAREYGPADENSDGALSRRSRDDHSASTCISGKNATHKLRTLAFQQQKDCYNPLAQEVALQK
jgi:hypothetical protein